MEYQSDTRAGSATCGKRYCACFIPLIPEWSRRHHKCVIDIVELLQRHSDHWLPKTPLRICECSGGEKAQWERLRKYAERVEVMEILSPRDSVIVPQRIGQVSLKQIRVGNAYTDCAILCVVNNRP